MLKGITLQQYLQIVAFVQTNHPFAHLPRDKRIFKSESGIPDCYLIKYIDNIYDTRRAEIWSVSFRGLGIDLRFSTNYFVLEDYKPDDFKHDNLFDWIMAFLKGEWKPSEMELKNMKS